MNVEKGLSVGGEKLKAWRFVGGEAVGICIVYRNNGGDKLTTKNVLFLTNNNLFEKKSAILFACYKKPFTFASVNKKREEADMITLNTLVNLAVLHIIRVVVVAPRGEKVSCM